MKNVLSILTCGVVALAMLPAGAFAQENPGAKPDVNGPDASGTSGGSGGWTAHGANTVQAGDKVLDAGIGWPELRVGFHIPVKTWFEVEPRLTFFYGLGFHTGLGNTFGVKLKFNVFHKDKLDISVEADPALVLAYPVGYWFAKTAVGIQLGLPAMTVSYQVIDKLWLIFGLDMPIVIFVTPAVFAEIPILFKAGVEYGINDKLHIFGIFEGGPDIYTGGGGIYAATAVSGEFKALLGVAYNF